MSSVQLCRREYSTSLPPRGAETKRGLAALSLFLIFRFDTKQDGPVGSGVSTRTAGSCGRDRRGYVKETKGRHERRKASDGRLRLRRGAPLRSDQPTVPAALFHGFYRRRCIGHLPGDLAALEVVARPTPPWRTDLPPPYHPHVAFVRVWLTLPMTGDIDIAQTSCDYPIPLDLSEIFRGFDARFAFEKRSKFQTGMLGILIPEKIHRHRSL